MNTHFFVKQCQSALCRSSRILTSKPTVHAIRGSQHSAGSIYIQSRFHSNVSANEFTVNVPMITESITSGQIYKWFRKEGDTVQMDQEICSLETEKTVLEIPTPYGGTLTKTFGEEGATVNVGDPLFKVLKK